MRAVLGVGGLAGLLVRCFIFVLKTFPERLDSLGEITHQSRNFSTPSEQKEREHDDNQYLPGSDGHFGLHPLIGLYLVLRPARRKYAASQPGRPAVLLH